MNNKEAITSNRTICESRACQTTVVILLVKLMRRRLDITETFLSLNENFH